MISNLKRLLVAGAALVCLCSVPVLATDTGQTKRTPVTLINVFTVPAGKEAEAIVFWEKAANFLKNQPGYISTKLHKSVQPNAKHGLINVAKWESAEAFKRASAAMRAKSGIKPVKGLSFAAALYTVIRSD